MKIKEIWKKYKVVWISGIVGAVLSYILLYSSLLNLQGKYPSGIELIIAVPGLIIFILIRLLFIFFGIDVGSMEEPKEFTIIISYILIIFLYAIIGSLIGILIQKLYRFIKK